MGVEITQSADSPQGNGGLSIFKLQGFHARLGMAAYPFQTSQDGRLLEEIRADHSAIAAARKLGRGPEERASKLEGSRRGLLENYTAFEAIAQRWKSPLDALAWINYQYYGEQIPDTIPLEDVASLAHIGVFIASFLLNKAGGYAPIDSLPNVAADVLKICRGIYTAAISLEEKDVRENTGKLSTNLATVAERDRLLLSIDSKVCPAPLPMISAALSALIDRTSAFASSEMNTLVSPEDFTRLQRFITLHDQYAELADQLYAEAFDLMEGIDQVDVSERQQFFNQRRKDYDKLLAKYMPLVQHVQDDLNLVLGRTKEDAPQVTAEALAQTEQITLADFANME